MLLLLLIMLMLWICRSGRRGRRRRCRRSRRRRRSRCGIDRYCRRCWRKRRRRLTGLTFVRWRYSVIIIGIQCRRWKSCSTISTARRRDISRTIDTFENLQHRRAELLSIELRCKIQSVDGRLISPLVKGCRRLIVFDSFADRMVQDHFVILNLSTHDPIALRV